MFLRLYIAINFLYVLEVKYTNRIKVCMFLNKSNLINLFVLLT